jgi:Fe2+ or Zn2+ uptake regulation protein
MKSYRERLTEARRLEILQLLGETPNYEAGHQLLHLALPDRGLNASGDQVRHDLAWLQEQELVTVADLEGTALARITQRGLDVAAGRTSVPGVQRPGPGG